ncbi:MAG: type II secretion system GspH family protein [Azoarcus sp.]|jgi:prepilin-type N-terminal cleavage/methylation domain-containing protein|nr:type II secretion system GspH family protein [Azoarcus sp.]
MPAVTVNPRARGFTLVEMAIVLVVLGLVAGALVTPLAARIEATQRRETAALLDDIAEALIGFALLHGRLPCPSLEADPASPAYGLEQPPPCADAAPGHLPWRTLALPAHDAWGSPRVAAGAPWIGHWRYLPDKHFTTGPILLATLPGSGIRVRDHGGEALTTADSRIVAVVYSAGPNRRDDGRNASWSPGAPTFEAGEPTPGFDDQLRWISHPLFIARLAQGGRL